ncbi:MAG: hypothetical protein FJY88_02530 [Candidatus Eisenbacteria bacterium]|nr:hypothetical protein [Candidatus Eisenbacteria bacterium]
MDRPTLARVHWQDGMLLRSAHLDLVEGRADELLDLTRRYLGHSPGICPGGEPSISCEISGSSLTVTLESCVALTPDGRLLIVDATRKEAGKAISAAISLDPAVEARIPVAIEAIEGSDPVGTPDPDEDPPRLPYRLPRVALLLGTDPGIGRPSSIRIAEIMVADRAARVSDDYIPPCAQIGSARAFAAAVEAFRARARACGARAVAGAAAMKARLDGEGIPGDPFFAILQQLAIGMGSARENLPTPPYPDPPLAALRPVRAVLRSALELFQIYPGARNRVINDLILREKLPSGDPVFFDSLRDFLDGPIALDDLRSAIGTHMRFLDDLDGVVRFLADQAKIPELDTLEEFYEYRGVRYWPIEYKHRRLRKDESRQYLEVGGIKARGDVKRILVIMRCAQGTPEERERFVIRFGVNDRKTWIFAEQVQVDARTEKNRIVCLYPAEPDREVPEPRLRELTLISGAVDFTPVENAPPTDLRIYGV